MSDSKGLGIAYAKDRRKRRWTETLMEQLPNWLIAAIAAAGMTAYADVYPKVRTDQVVEDAPAPPDAIPPIL